MYKKSFLGLSLSLALFSASPLALAAPTLEQPDRNEALYNLQDKVGLKGYDPVSYFEAGKAQAGQAAIQAEYGGVIYYFASEANRALFLEDPTRFEPTYGGWCAWAMSNKSYADIDPNLFTLHGDRAHFFISRGAKARFDQDLAAREKRADNFWMNESGESPRNPN